MKHGFTIVELLIVLAILAVGISLGLTQVQTIRTKASEKTLVARLKQLQIAKLQFIQEYGRIEAATAWTNALANNAAAISDRQARYNLLKRYIERPINDIAQVAPADYSITVPADVTGTFTGYKTSDTGTTFSASDN